MLVTGNLVSTEWKVGSLLTSYINTKDHRRRDSRVSEVTFYSVVVIMMVEFSSSSSQDGGGNTRYEAFGETSYMAAGKPNATRRRRL